MSSASRWEKKILLLLLGNYIAVSAVVSLAHNHEADFIFHDSCPACQWDVQSQEDFSEILSLLTSLMDPLTVVGIHSVVCYTPNIQQSLVESYLSRAPPSLS